MSEFAHEPRVGETSENLRASKGDVCDKMAQTQSYGNDSMLEQDAMLFVNVWYLIELSRFV